MARPVEHDTQRRLTCVAVQEPLAERLHELSPGRVRGEGVEQPEEGAISRQVVDGVAGSDGHIRVPAQPLRGDAGEPLVQLEADDLVVEAAAEPPVEHPALATSNVDQHVVRGDRQPVAGGEDPVEFVVVRAAEEVGSLPGVRGLLVAPGPAAIATVLPQVAQEGEPAVVSKDPERGAEAQHPQATTQPPRQESPRGPSPEST